jgi:photosynthetic reaction center cytochrome c subunit
MNSQLTTRTAGRFRASVFPGAIAGIAMWCAMQVAAQTAPQKTVEMSAQASPENLPAEKVFENIQVLKGMRAAEMQSAMSFIASSLGVDCDYCHRQNFGGDTVPAKLRAREMMAMVRGINQGTFHGENAVNCFTCHQGSAKPVSLAPIVAAVAANSGAAKPVQAAEIASSSANATGENAALPTVSQVLDRYVEALGGAAALGKIQSRVTKVTPLSGKNPEYVTETYLKAPGKIEMTQASPGYTFWAGFDGTRAWAQDSDKSYWGILSSAQRNELMRESEIYQGARLRNGYTDVKVTRKEKVGERETYVVAGTSPEGVNERFYFDAETGLLLRRHFDEPSVFGLLQVQCDLEDYREVDGVKIPFAIRWNSAGRSWGMRTSSKIIEIKNNAAIDDERFAHPPAAPAK